MSENRKTSSNDVLEELEQGEDPNASLRRKWLWGLAILTAFVLVVAGGLYLLGGGSKVNKESVVLNAPPHMVWAHLTEPGKVKNWIGGMEKMELLDGPPLRVGSRLRETIKIDRDTYELEMEVTELEPGRLIAFRIDGPEGHFTANSFHRLKSVPGGTRLTVQIESTYHTAAARIFSIAITRSAQAKLEKDLVHLQKVIEKLATQPDTP